MSNSIDYLEMCIRDSAIIKDALAKTREARYQILDEIMLPCISEPRHELAKKMCIRDRIFFTLFAAAYMGVDVQHAEAAEFCLCVLHFGELSVYISKSKVNGF